MKAGAVANLRREDGRRWCGPATRASPIRWPRCWRSRPTSTSTDSTTSRRWCWRPAAATRPSCACSSTTAPASTSAIRSALQCAFFFIHHTWLGWVLLKRNFFVRVLQLQVIILLWILSAWYTKKALLTVWICFILTYIELVFIFIFTVLFF